MLQKKSDKIVIFFIAVVFLLCWSNSFAQKAALSKSIKDSLIKELSVIAGEDQHYRQQMETVQTQYGGDSKEMKQLVRSMKQTDSLNFIKVSAILETFGWLGPDEIGSSANTTLFMVIQHSDIIKQEFYLPQMRIAVNEGKAYASELALLEDRVALSRNKKQLYGSQVSWNMKTNEYHLMPLEDPEHVDQRRREVGLSPLKDYLKSCCGMEWNLTSYLKEQEATKHTTDH